MDSIKVKVPSGESCLNCIYQEDFDIAEMRCDTIGEQPMYIRSIVATCRLFNEPISGKIIDRMGKCDSCRR